MQLRSLRVRNIRSYPAATLDLAGGTTLISGDVGSGKTSLLYAIEMALFGFAEVDPAFLVRHGATHSEVSLVLDDKDAHRYEICRRFRRRLRKGRETFEPEEASFAVDGARKSYSATELRQRVIDLLRFPDNPNPRAHSDLWRWAVYVPQERMREVLDQDPQDRLETVRKALGLERYRTAAENAQLVAADLRRRSDRCEAKAEGLRHWEDELSRTEESLRASVEEVAGLEDLRRSSETRVVERERGVLELEATWRERLADEREASALEEQEREDRHRSVEIEGREQDLRTAIARQHEEIAERRRDADAIPAAADALERHRAERERLREALTALEETRRRFDSVESQWRATRERATAVAELARSSEAERGELQHALDAVRAEKPLKEPPAPTTRSLAEIDAAIDEARRRETAAIERAARRTGELEEIDALLAEGVCPRCHQAVHGTTFAAQRKEIEDALLADRAAHDSARSARADLEAERKARDRFERSRDRWLDVERRRSLARESLERSESRLAQVREMQAEVSDLAARLAAEVERLGPSLGEYDRHRAALDAREIELPALEGELLRLRQRQEEANAAEAIVRRIAEEVERLVRERALIGRRVAERAERLRALRGTASAAEELARRIEEERREVASLREAAAEVTVRLAASEERRRQTTARAGEARAGRVQREEVLREAARLGALAEWLAGPFRTGILGIEEELLAHALATFDRRFATYFQSLLDDPSMRARADASFTPTVEIAGEWTPPEALSGGERTALALAFRLALADVVRSLGEIELETLLLDEPTDGFSPEQVLRMGELLDSLRLPQVVIVSHESQLAAIADREVRVRKTDGASELYDPLAPAAPAVAAIRPAAQGRRRLRPERLEAFAAPDAP